MSKPVPEIFRRPKIAVGIMLAADLALMAGAVIASRIAESAEVTYTYIDDTVRRSEPMAPCGIIAACALLIQCGLAAVLFAGNLLSGRGGDRAAARNVGAALLLAVSVGVTGVFAAAALGLPPQKTQFFSYTDETNQLIIEERQTWFSKGGALDVFRVEGEDAELLVSTGLEVISPGAERYTLAWLAADVLQIGFEDNGRYRTLQILWENGTVEVPPD